MIMLYDLQMEIKRALESDSDFNRKTYDAFNDHFSFEIDKSEVVSTDVYPMFVIHKNFASETNDGSLYAIQFNIIVPLGCYGEDGYQNIKIAEELSHDSIAIADRAACGMGLKRESTNIFIAAPIDGADDIEFVVAIGYSSMNETNFI